MLLVGRDWVRKGCDSAIDILLAVRARGVTAELTLIGPVPPSGFGCPPGVRVLPPLEKTDAGQARQLMRAFREASFYVQPSRRECLGVAYIEAAAYGLPMLGYDVGGVDEIVVEGRNGVLLPPSARAEDFAERLCRLWTDGHCYRAYSQASRRLFEERFNWEQWGRTMTEWLRAVARPSIDRQQAAGA
jgi:glycosyltransferase involved in cell wall biosynthesis